MSLAATGAQAQETVNICNRTMQVQDAILLFASDEDTCARVPVSLMTAFVNLSLGGKQITSLQSGDFAGLPNVESIDLRDNQLNKLPAGIFSGFSKLRQLYLQDNPGAPFRFTVRFEPPTLEKDFTATKVRVVLREGAPTTITVPLSESGTGGALFNSPNPLTIPRGATRSDPATVIPGVGFFRLSQEEPEWNRANQFGYEIVKGPPLTVGGVRMKVRVFLEGALE